LEDVESRKEKDVKRKKGYKSQRQICGETYAFTGCPVATKSFKRFTAKGPFKKKPASSYMYCDNFHA
jgi:hypothetical protein